MRWSSFLPHRSELFNKRAELKSANSIRSMRAVVSYLLECTICPPRATYDPEDTVSVITSDDGSVYERSNVEFKTEHNLVMRGSFWTKQDQSKSNRKPHTCCFYLHSLGTNQFEALNIVPFLCTENLALFAFDFPGCGISDGDATPLDGSGCQIVLDAVNHISANYEIDTFAIWGRSMGAAIALHTVSVCSYFSCVVSDSAFECTRKIVTDQAEVNHIPVCLINLAFPIFKREAFRRLKIDIDTPFPIEYVPSASTPLLLGHGNKDTFVLPSHARHLFASYGHKNKQLYLFQGKHNSARPRQWYESVARFIYRHCGIKDPVRSYNHVYASSHLHVGKLSFVLSEIESQRASSVLESPLEGSAAAPKEDEETTKTEEAEQGHEEECAEKKHRKHRRHRHKRRRHHREPENGEEEEEETEAKPVMEEHQYHELMDFGDVNSRVFP